MMKMMTMMMMISVHIITHSEVTRSLSDRSRLVSCLPSRRASSDTPLSVTRGQAASVTARRFRQLYNTDRRSESRTTEQPGTESDDRCSLADATLGE
jgi:hypothetical protein